MIRDERTRQVTSYRLHRDGNSRLASDGAIQQLRAEVGESDGFWERMEEKNWGSSPDQADMEFVLGRLHELFDALSRSRLFEHALSCQTCFIEAVQNELKGYKFSEFRRQFLPPKSDEPTE